MFKLDKHEDIEIRFDPDSSIFFCIFLGKNLRSENLNDLKSLIKKEAKANTNVSWKPVIEICLDDLSYHYSGRHSSGFSVEKKLFGEKVYPDGKVEELLATLYQGSDSDDFKDWKPVGNPEVWTKSDNVKLVSFSPEKFKSLKFICDKMDEMRTELMRIIKEEDLDTFLPKINMSQLTLLENKDYK